MSDSVKPPERGQPAEQPDDGGHADYALEVRGAVVMRGANRAVDGVDLRLKHSEIACVLGPSGAGKSSLFGAIAGQFPLRAGEVALGGQTLGAMPMWRRARQGLGYMPQGASVLLDLSVEQNLQTFCRLTGQGQKPAALAKKVGLDHRRGVRAGQLSGGERRRLELARCLAAKPKVLLCDEPFAGVDPKGMEELSELLRQLAKSGVAVLLSDHHVRQALALARFAHLLVDGKLVVRSRSESFAEQPQVQAKYYHSLDGNLRLRSRRRGLRGVFDHPLGSVPPLMNWLEHVEMPSIFFRGRDGCHRAAAL